MPPGKRAEGPSSGSVAQGLSQLYQDSAAGDLSLSLSASLSRAEDEELTSLSWLHESTDLLTSLGHPGLRSVSPLQDTERYCEPSLPSSSLQKPSEPCGVMMGPSCKPPYSFSCLIFMAIEDAPSKRLPVKDIYGWILEHFPYFASAPTGWKNSVRHNLSLNKCFKKVDKDRSQSIGKGSLWSIDPEYRHNLIQALKKTPYQPYAQWPISTRSCPQQYSSRPLWPGSQLFRKNVGVILQVPQRVIQHSSLLTGQGLSSVIRPLPMNLLGKTTSARVCVCIIRSALDDAQGRDSSPGDDPQEETSFFNFQRDPSSRSLHIDSPACSQGLKVSYRITEVKEEPRDFPLDATIPPSQLHGRRTNCTKGLLLKPGDMLPLKKRRAEKLLASGDEDEEMKEAAGSLLHLAGVQASQSKTSQHTSRVQREGGKD
ncbi:checkpoint suppressor 1 isoform X1 [Electrophorus electricus]|uniref:checkpoint suppressor 1 isoform X1 n=1 Tax=Electrophorus electricus TaxID=8005 RepID=UPI0015D09978|nr:checkpoint suppressor 1 isoform X1 [Electrophorus electricus]XP_035380088.1 checkpoint suppressor 1 isoform X1 [Electrophorus electricus]XP_035380089.1 checkpoint suppressor 1 isoform X1 [Electrophorus electricus]XP_035380090.1 checkpoint suppressor 1 isoform X1 [Electrophorus electricus]XP_035380091.1 checkpoint suppressor 1 isoform X1 [Electrophorus electricus]XP_035380092.1 checkpoint suppressor 1 isoform X1 [Electrophorus electricus]